MKYEKLATDIIKNVGGKENVISVEHCITRLRFKLKDKSKANTEVLKNMDDVITVIQSGGQYQVVIGNQVGEVFDEVVSIGAFQAGEETESDEKVGIFNKFIDMITGVFTPVLGLLCAEGIIKGMAALIIGVKWVSATSGTYIILNAIGDTLFYFFPIFLGYTSAKKFKLNEFVGIAIGGSLLYPTIANITTTGKPLYTLFNGTIFKSPVYLTFLGIPVILMTYSSSVIPIILSTYMGSKIEKLFKKIIPDIVKSFFVPLCTLLVTVPLTFIIIGPIATFAGQLVGAATLAICNVSPVLEGIILGATWQVFVIFGLHWGLIPICLNNLATMHYDPVIAPFFTASFAQIGVVAAIILRTKNTKLKTIAVPAFISGVFGITEPCLYGVTLPRKKPFILSCIGAAAGGGIIGLMGSKMYSFAGGLLGITIFISPKGIDKGFYGAVIATIVSFAIGFILMFFSKFDDEENEKETKNTEDTLVKQEIVNSPLKGTVKALSEIKDEAFSKGALGKGIAIEPTEGKVIAPVDGVVTTLFPTSHAIGITSKNGVEILIHIGMNTVQLKGKYFTPKIKQGDEVKKGQELLEFDINAIKKEGYSLVTPIVVTNSNEYMDVIETDKNDIKYNDNLLTVIV